MPILYFGLAWEHIITTNQKNLANESGQNSAASPRRFAAGGARASAGCKLLLALVVPALLLGLLEAGLRLTNTETNTRQKTLWKPTVSGYWGTFEFYLPTDFSPPGYIWVSQPDTPFTDRYGFRLPEIPIEKPADKIRVAFLGGSTTHGGFRPYPERAIRLINAALGTNQYEMLNVACSSYSTHQSLIALDRWALPRKPDIVFVYHGWNDMWVAGDGFSDKEKDALLSSTGGARFPLPIWIAELKLTGLVGRFLQFFDHDWPRQRVSFADFESNLERMADMCAAHGIKMFVMIRPEQRESLFDSKPMDPLTEQYARQAFNTTNHYELYKTQSARIIAAQRAVAERHAHVEACDGNASVNQMLDLQEAGQLGEQVSVFYSDNIHLMDLADELLAQRVALTIASQHAVAISNLVNSIAYEATLAEELLREDAPREAVWFINRALARNPGTEDTAQLLAMREQARENFFFTDLFRSGRWGGDEPDFIRKIAKLKQCLEIRPSDYGVMLQIYRVCIYMNRLEEAAPAMAGFKPSNDQQKHEWLTFVLESNLQGQRWQQARRTAEKLITLDPRQELAIRVLNEIPPGI